MLEASEGSYTFQSGFQANTRLTLITSGYIKETSRIINVLVSKDEGEATIDVWDVFPTEIIQGQQVTLRWKVSHAESVRLLPFGTVDAEGERTDKPQQSKTYTLIVSSGGQTIEKAQEVIVSTPSPDAPQVTQFQINPISYTQGEQASITLSWTTKNADVVTIEPGLGPVGLNGNREIPAPTKDTLFTLVARGPGGETSAVAFVSVAPAPVPTVVGGGGERLAFSAAGSGGKASLFTVKLDGSGLTRLTNDGLGGSFTPDGSSLVFSQGTSDNNARPVMYISNLAGSVSQIAAQGWYPSWSPDGKLLVYMVRNTNGNYGVYTGMPDGHTTMMIYETRISFLEGLHHLTWSPDGKQVAFVDIENTGSDPNVNIFIADVGGANVRQLTYTGTAWTPDWSPDGKTIVFSGWEGNFDIYTYPAAGSGRPPTNLSRTPSVAEILPTWSPDGTMIAYGACQLSDNRCDLYIMQADGTNPQLVLSGQPILLSLDWQPAQR